MWRCYLLVTSIFFSFRSFSQTEKPDSLLLALAKSTPQQYTALIAQLETSIQNLPYADGLKAADQILLITRQFPFKAPLSGAYRIKAMVYNRHEHRAQALQAAWHAYRLAHKGKFQAEEAHGLKLIGNIYQALGRQELALKHYLQALEIYHQLGLQKSEAETLYALGNLCYFTHKYNTSRRYLLKAYELGRDSLESRLLISTVNTIALTHRAKDEFLQALSYQQQAHQMALQAKDSAWVGLTAGNMAKIYELQKAYEKALPYYQLDLQLSKKFNIWGSVAITYVSIAGTHLQQKEYATAKQFLDSAMYLSRSVKEPDFLQNFYKTLSGYYFQTRQPEKALHYQTLYYTVKDSLDKRKYNAELERVMASYEWDKKQTEIELLKKDKEIIQAEADRKNSTLFAITGILLLIAILAFILFRNNRQKQKANQTLTLQQTALSEKNGEIKRLNNSLEQKVEERTRQLQMAMEKLVKKNQHLEDFAYVISHNLRAPIARIMGLISIFNKENLQDSGNLPILQHLNTAALNLDMVVNDLNDILLMQHLSQDHKEEVELEEVTGLALESLHELIKTSDANIQTDYSQVSKLVTIKSYITSILYNLLSNAIKYKSPARKPEILIKTARLQDMVCVTISDNGIGMDLTQNTTKKLFKLYQRMHTHTEGKGMGLFIVKEQVDALQGKIEIESAPDQGCTFHIYLPV